MRELIEAPLTQSVLNCFFEVYNTLGYGFLESIYAEAMEKELLSRNHTVDREISVPVTYKEWYLGRQRIDMIVDKKVVIEIKSTLELHPSARRQVRSYLQGTRLEVGLLLHFGPEAKFYRQIATNPETPSIHA